MTKTVFITGATSGFGKATAELFAENGYNLIITGRRQERLDILSEKLKLKHDIDIISLCFDVRNKEAVVNGINSLDNTKIDLLINNAGLASGVNKIQDGSLDDWDKMIDHTLSATISGTSLIIKGTGFIKPIHM